MSDRVPKPSGEGERGRVRESVGDGARASTSLLSSGREVEGHSERLVGGDLSDEARDAALGAARARVEPVFGAAKAALLFEAGSGGAKSRSVRGRDLWRIRAAPSDELTALCEALKVTRCLIERLDLGGRGLGAEGAAAVAEALKVTSCPIQMLDLSRNRLGRVGGAAVAEALEVTSCPIQTLHLFRNELGPEGGAALAEALKVTRCPIQVLNLDVDELGPDAEASIDSALADCKRLAHRIWDLRHPIALFWLACRFTGESAAWRARGQGLLVS